ncbi:hypothetical protein, partial [Streptomyces sp. NPDC058861]|uniref:hypothetical protein n=1 Tax=Streptomyces sp. NPDC058861 TaxID=3346653 RepID=UPI0036CA800B
MAADESALDRRDGQRPDPVQDAIDWFAHDTSDTPQDIPTPGGAVGPGTLLTEALRQAAFDDLLAPSASRQQELVEAQAAWLIRHMPDDHEPRALDSAQQAGRAWGILIAAVADVHPSPQVVAEVVRQTRITPRAADEIANQSLKTSAAFNRADLLIYDNVPDAVLVEDWNRLAACGPELPEAAERATDVLDLIAARISGDDYAWMSASAQEAAQLYDSVIRVQPLLQELGPLVPARGHPGAAAAQERLLALEHQGVLTAASTAAARARAVHDWARAEPEPQLKRIRLVEAAGPGTRTLLALNEVLERADPAGRKDVDRHRLAEIVQLIGHSSARDRQPSKTSAGTRPKSSRHPHPPTPGGPNVDTPRLGGFVWITALTKGRCPRCGVRPGRWSLSSRSG